jgi:hypothetical protein
MVSGRGRHDERGAALFVVVLVITLLTAVGLFAAQSATLVDQASGYSRQAAQTGYLAEYGVLATTAELGSGAAGAYRARMLNPKDTCRMNQGMDSTDTGPPPCLVLQLNDFAAPSGGSMLDTSALPLAADFVVEVTDLGPSGAPIAGTDVGGTGNAFGYMKVTATTIAQLRPASAAACVENVTPVAGQQLMRAHLIVGPVAE